MTSNQLHGKRFEDFIKGCGLFPGAADSSRTMTADFDIEARFDRERGLPTSVKSSGNNTVALSDARRFFAIDIDFRMIVGRYSQSGDQKVFAEIHEFILTPAALGSLRGDLDLATVTEFHEGILLSRFPRGSHANARAWARQRKLELDGTDTRIILNPKIDSKRQRRLQCSVALASLIESSQQLGLYILHNKAIGHFALPIIQNSARRVFKSA